MRRFLEKVEEAKHGKIGDFGALAQQWRDLEAAGIPLEPLENRAGISARSPSGILTIRSESHRLGGSEIRELKDGRFGYVLRVFIRSDSPGKTIIRDSLILPPWTRIRPSNGSKIRRSWDNILSGTPSPRRDRTVRAR